VSDADGKDVLTSSPPSKVAHTRARAREEAIGEICGYLREGMPRNMACDLAGVPRRTFYNWLADEEAAALVDQALAEGAQAEVAKLRLEMDFFDSEHGRDRARAANVRQKWLTMVYPDYFGVTQKVDITATIRKEVDAMPEAELLAEAEAIVARAKALPADAVDAELEGDGDASEQ
jgi:hypothetical protein